MNDTRKDKRAPLSLKVRFKSATVDEFIEHYARDISRGGLFIKSKQPMPIGTLLKFEFQLKDESKLIQGVGRVVWKREAEGDGADTSPAGMGIKFIKMDADSKALVEQIVEGRGDAPGQFEAGAPAGALEDEAAGGAKAESPPDAPTATTQFFPSTTPESELPPPEDRTQVRHASEFLASALALVGTDSLASKEAERKAEEARKRSEEIEREREAQARAAVEEEERAAQERNERAEREAEERKAAAEKAAAEKAAAEQAAAEQAAADKAAAEQAAAEKAATEKAAESAKGAEPAAAPAAESAKGAEPAAPAKAAPRAAEKTSKKAAPKAEPAKAEGPAKKDETPKKAGGAATPAPKKVAPAIEPAAPAGGGSNLVLPIAAALLVGLAVVGYFLSSGDRGEPAATAGTGAPAASPPAASPAAEAVAPPGEPVEEGVEEGPAEAPADLPPAEALTTGTEGAPPPGEVVPAAALTVFYVDVTTTPPGATVRIGDTTVTAPDRIELPSLSGPLPVTATLAGYEDASTTLTPTSFSLVDERRVARVSLTLNRRPAPSEPAPSEPAPSASSPGPRAPRSRGASRPSGAAAPSGEAPPSEPAPSAAPERPSSPPSTEPSGAALPDNPF